MSLIALPRDQYGIFHDTDSYVVYASSQYGHSSGVDTVVSQIIATINIIYCMMAHTR